MLKYPKEEKNLQPSKNLKTIPVAVGILYQNPKHSNQVIQYLFAQRPIGKPFAGFWEFPGGKIEPNEAPLNALVRELHEEIAVKIDVENCRALMPPFYYDYENYQVFLHIFLINDWQGQPIASENQHLMWASLDQQSDLQPMLPAASIILEALLNWQEN